MKEIVILSLDYDGCGDLLFEEAMETGRHIWSCKHLPGYTEVIKEARSALEYLLTFETTGADVVELCVGSKRQGRKFDKYCCDINENGLVFEMYADLAEKRQWNYNRLLLADFELDTGELRSQPREPGTAMGRLKKNETGKYKYENDYIADRLAGPINNDKERILTRQIESAILNHPEKKIKFVFIDDSLDVIRFIANYFNPETNSRLPSNVELKLIQFDYYPIFQAVKEEKVQDVASIIKDAEQIINYIATMTVKEKTPIKNSNAAIEMNGSGLKLFSGAAHFWSNNSKRDESRSNIVPYHAENLLKNQGNTR